MRVDFLKCPVFVRVASKGGISRLAQMRKPQCTDVHEDFRIKRNAESTLLSRSQASNKYTPHPTS